MAVEVRSTNPIASKAFFICAPDRGDTIALQRLNYYRVDQLFSVRDSKTT